MNTALRNSILCLVAIGLVAGVTGTIYGVTKKTRDLVNSDAGSVSSSVSTSSSGSTSQPGSSLPASSTPGSSSSSSSSSSSTPATVTPKLVLSKDSMVLDASAVNTLPTSSVSATITGTWTKDKTIIWESTGNSFFSLSKASSTSGEAITVSALTTFVKTLWITAYAQEDHTLRVSIPVSFYNRIYSSEIASVEINHNGSRVHTIAAADNTTTSDGGAGAFTSEGTNGTYFKCPGLQMTAAETALAKDPESALTMKNVIDVTCSSDYSLLIHYRVFEAFSAIKPTYARVWDSAVTDMTAFVEPNYSETTKFTLSLKYQDEYDSGAKPYWIYKYELKLDTAFKSGVIMLRIDDNYAAIRFHEYVAPASIGGVGDTTI